MGAYPIGTHFDNVWLPIFILAKWLVPGTSTDSIAVFENREIVDRRIGQCLLRFVSGIFRNKGENTHSSSNSSNTTSSINEIYELASNM
jgi:hypothetical protein